MPAPSQKKTTYLGQNMLKKAGVKIEWSQDQIAEYIKCSQDPIYFIENYCQVINLDEGQVKFKLRPYQVAMIRMMHENRFSFSLTSRQIGKTVAVCGYLCWCVIFRENCVVGIAANKGQTATEILSKKILNMMKCVPMWLQVGTIECNKTDWSFENGSRFLARATSEDAFRNYSLNILYIDELDFIDNGDAFFAASYQTLTSGKTTKMICTTTPHPFRLGLAYKLVKSIERGESDFQLFRTTWRCIPERDEEWKRKEIARIGVDRFNSEQETMFAAGSASIINIQKLQQIAVLNPMQIVDNDLYVYAKPQPNRNYVLLVDTSRGTLEDYSAFLVVDATELPYKVVARYRRNDISHMVYPTIIERIGRYYNNAMTLIELNDLGEAVAGILWNDLEYESLIFCDSKVGRGGGQTAGSGKQMGVRTTAKTKNIGCTVLKNLIDNDMLQINDIELLSELTTFAPSGGSYAASDGNHDDLAMCLVLFAWLTTQNYFKEMYNIDIRKMAYKNQIEQQQQELAVLMPTISNGHPTDEPVSGTYHDLMQGDTNRIFL